MSLSIELSKDVGAMCGGVAKFSIFILVCPTHLGCDMPGLFFKDFYTRHSNCAKISSRSDDQTLAGITDTTLYVAALNARG